MITLTFKSGRQLHYRRTDTVDLLLPDNRTERVAVHTISPGALVAYLGIVILMEFGDDEPRTEGLR